MKGGDNSLVLPCQCGRNLLTICSTAQSQSRTVLCLQPPSPCAPSVPGGSYAEVHNYDREVHLDMATVLMVVDEAPMKYAYALSVVDRERIADCLRHPRCQCAPSSPCQARALPFEDAFELLQRSHMLTPDCKSQLLADCYNTAGLVADDRAIALTCGVQGVIVTSLVRPLHIEKYCTMLMRQGADCTC